MGFGEGFGAFDGLLYEMRRIEKEKLTPRVGIESSIIPAWGHSYGGRKKSTTNPFY